MHFSERRGCGRLLRLPGQALPQGHHGDNADIGGAPRFGLYRVQVPLHGPAGLRQLLVEEAVVGLLGVSSPLLGTFILTRGAGASTSAQDDDEFGNPILTLTRNVT